MNDELKPGRELDALVAERVMGWTRGKEEVYHERDWDSVYTRPCWLADGKPLKWTPDNFRPSIDIAAAWQVVEEMRCKDFNFLILSPADPYTFTCHFYPGGEQGHIVTHEKPATAICLAALKTLGIK